jgi:hypothetical protein
MPAMVSNGWHGHMGWWRVLLEQFVILIWERAIPQ